MLKLIFAVLLFIPSVTFGATIYIDGTLGTNCTSGNYSIANRNCSGSNGNAYNNIVAALSASAANDTAYLRAGSYTSNVVGTDGITPLAGQTWSGYQSESVTITAAATHRFVFSWIQRNNITIRNLTLRGGRGAGIYAQNSVSSVLENLDIADWGAGGSSEFGGYTHAVNFGSFDSNFPMTNARMTSIHVHSPHPLRGQWNGGLTLGGFASNGLIENNLVEDVNFGIWFDVNSGRTALGLTPHTAQNNIVKNIVFHCFHIEDGSAAIFRNNIGINCQDTGFLLRPGAKTMQDVKFQNNTLYNVGKVGIWLQNDQGSAVIQNTNIDNNIIFSAVNTNHLLIVGTGVTTATGNTYRNNLFYSSSNDLAVCWGDNVGTSWSCETGIQYTDTSTAMSQFNSNVSQANGNIAGNPLFANAASGDFRLCTGPGSPASTCTAKSPAIDAGINVGLPYNLTAPDIGAMESAGSSSGLPAPTNLQVSTQ
jgi:Right handed beta helix region